MKFYRIILIACLLADHAWGSIMQVDFNKILKLSVPIGHARQIQFPTSIEIFDCLGRCAADTVRLQYQGNLLTVFAVKQWTSLPLVVQLRNGDIVQLQLQALTADAPIDTVQLLKRSHGLHKVFKQLKKRIKEVFGL